MYKIFSSTFLSFIFAFTSINICASEMINICASEMTPITTGNLPPEVWSLIFRYHPSLLDQTAFALTNKNNKQLVEDDSYLLTRKQHFEILNRIVNNEDRFQDGSSPEIKKNFERQIMFAFSLLNAELSETTLCCKEIKDQYSHVLARCWVLPKGAKPKEELPKLFALKGKQNCSLVIQDDENFKFLLDDDVWHLPEILNLIDPANEEHEKHSIGVNDENGKIIYMIRSSKEAFDFFYPLLEERLLHLADIFECQIFGPGRKTLFFRYFPRHHREFIESLLKISGSGMVINIPAKPYGVIETPLAYICFFADKIIIQRTAAIAATLTRSGAVVNIRDPKSTLLHSVCRQLYLHSVRSLKEFWLCQELPNNLLSLMINKQDENGNTPLHILFLKDKTGGDGYGSSINEGLEDNFNATLDFLLEQEADPKIENNNGENVYDLTDDHHKNFINYYIDYVKAKRHPFQYLEENTNFNRCPLM